MEIQNILKDILAFLFGRDNQNILRALIALVILDYLTGVCVAIHNQKLSSAIGSKGITKKVMIFVLISLSNIVDQCFLQGSNSLGNVTTLFYCANETISIVENAAKIGIPIPQKLRKIFASIGEKN